jgi:hypothetical protein
MAKVRDLWYKTARTYLAKCHNNARKVGMTPNLHYAIQKAFIRMEIRTSIDDIETVPISFPEVLQGEQPLMALWDRITAFKSTLFPEADQPTDDEKDNFHIYNQALPLGGVLPNASEDPIIQAIEGDLFKKVTPKCLIHYTTDGRIDRLALWAMWQQNNEGRTFEHWLIHMKVHAFASENNLKIALPQCFADIADPSTREFLVHKWFSAFELEGVFFDDWFAHTGRFCCPVKVDTKTQTASMPDFAPELFTPPPNSTSCPAGSRRTKTAR